MGLMDMGDQPGESVLGAECGEMGDLGFEAADEVGGGVDDRAAEREDRVGIVAQMNREFRGLGV